MKFMFLLLPLEARVSAITLGVSDLERFYTFYHEGLRIGRPKRKYYHLVEQAHFSVVASITIFSMGILLLKSHLIDVNYEI